MQNRCGKYTRTLHNRQYGSKHAGLSPILSYGNGRQWRIIQRLQKRNIGVGIYGLPSWNSCVPLHERFQRVVVPLLIKASSSIGSKAVGPTGCKTGNQACHCDKGSGA